MKGAGMKEDKRKIEDQIRINKYLSQAGVCARRQAYEYIAQ
jgi:23S rRNA pseudouridine2604 synthase